MERERDREGTECRLVKSRRPSSHDGASGERKTAHTKIGIIYCFLQTTLNSSSAGMVNYDPLSAGMMETAGIAFSFAYCFISWRAF